MVDDDQRRCACGCGLPVRKNRGEWKRFRHGHRARLQPKGHRAHSWKTGTTRQRGYVLIQMPAHPRANKDTGYVRRAVIVVEQALKRPLRADEVVYHRNRRRDDDRLENLKVVRRGAKGLTKAAIEEIRQLLLRLACRAACPRTQSTAGSTFDSNHRKAVRRFQYDDCGDSRREVSPFISFGCDA
jgi:hypothetical protein